MLLDDFMPAYHFNEVHSVAVPRSDRGSASFAPSLFRAIKEVTPQEIRLLGALFWVRSLPAMLTELGQHPGRRGPRPVAERPLLEQALRAGFILLAEEPERELGTLLLAPAAYAILLEARPVVCYLVIFALKAPVTRR